MTDRRYTVAAAVMLLCCGCTAQPAPESQSETAIATTAATTVTKASEELAAAETTAETALFQGGIGDERNAEIPLPEHFVYRFFSDSVSVRLAGGTYQVLSYDFSAIFEQERGQIAFYLDDYDGDGYYDLFAPTQYDGDEILAYAVFLWNPEKEVFSEQPLIYQGE